MRLVRAQNQAGTGHWVGKAGPSLWSVQRPSMQSAVANAVATLVDHPGSNLY
eukprot:CAMPEP_0204528464 /NCGR_PEP_ID=MMETSP0661-20131031/9545_1 /ASSEMBLY_ACC=CAM_ASM_000606 /TAXON_ID=109239 /ORGANISM="Alexandrium margalefi, Strain AMGDE01CS-322" /LENGTH=51 /DNA_ID=CAMNT_0051534445 /DNA_START=217 /DNA_END=369 /DNA_ORIENTATION=-